MSHLGCLSFLLVVCRRVHVSFRMFGSSFLLVVCRRVHVSI